MCIVTLKSDGASVPNFLRKYIVKRYGQEMMDKIDWCGYRHDGRVECECLTTSRARALFYIDLVNVGVPIGLTEILYIGLTVYDRSPKFIRYILKGSDDTDNLISITINLQINIEYEQNPVLIHSH